MLLLRAGRRPVFQIQNLRLERVIQSNRRYSSKDPTKPDLDPCKPEADPCKPAPPPPFKPPTPPSKWYQSGINQFLVAAGTVLLLSGSTVAYAKYDESGNFRRKVEKYVPGSGAVFDLVLGSSKEPVCVADALDDPMFSRNYQSEMSTSDCVKIEDDQSSVFVSRETEPVIKDQGKVQLSCQKDIPSHSKTTAFTDSPILSMKNPQTVVCPQTARPVANEIDAQEVAKKIDALQQQSGKNTQKDTNKIDSHETPSKIDTEKVTHNINTREIADNIDSLLVATKINKQEVANTVGTECETEKLKDPLENISKQQKVEFDVSSAIIDDVLSCTSVACANAILMNHAAAKALAIHSSLLRTALDDMRADPYEKSMQWSDVAMSLTEKDKKLLEADLCYDKAREEVAKLSKVLGTMNVSNTLIKRRVAEVEENCKSLSQELFDSIRKVDNQKVAAKALGDYQSSIENTKSNLQSGLSLPEGKRVEEWKRQGVQLSCREDIDALRNLHEQKEELQEKLMAERTLSAARIQEAIDEVRAETIAKLRKEYEEEMERMLGEERKVHQIDMSEALTEHEMMMQRELKKQASHHAEHLAEALTFIDQQARERYEVALRREIDTQREEFEKGLEEEKLKFESEKNTLQEKHQVDLNAALARLQGIRSAIDGRAQTESEVRKALELSLACESLLVSLKYGDQGEPLPLRNHVDTIKDVYGEHPAIGVLSSSLPSEVRERGAYPEDTIRRKLHDTMQICKRVSLVNENRNSLFVYLLSYLKSWLIVSRPSTEPPEQLEPSSLDCFKVISYANYCLQRGDIEQAVRFLNQLKGEPRIRAERWLKEARLYLETKQSVDALCAISDSIVIGAQLEK